MPYRSLLGKGTYNIAMASNLRAMASNLLAMASNLEAMASLRHERSLTYC